MLKSLTSYALFIGMTGAVGMILWAAHWALIKRHPDLGSERRFPRQLILLGLTLLGILVCILVLPVSDSSRNQLIGLFGIVLSGLLAFSSTTVISNLMAGVLLRITKPFKAGDFIRIGDYFGRVSERGLFDTEIQTETRELIALPNTYCIKNPVSTILSSGTIISASLSLGYDIDHRKIESLLMEAARTCGLAEPFVHIMELGNFAVTYRISGFLEESKRLISVRSNLYACVLDTLHSQGIEIMSPTFMNQRQIHGGTRIIPSSTVVDISNDNTSSAEDIAFDKAERAEELENEKRQVMQEIEELERALKEIKSEEEKKAKQKDLEQLRHHLKSLAEAPEEERENGRVEPKTAQNGNSSVPWK